MNGRSWRQYLIKDERTRHNILNSNTEYNRCSLPRLCAQIGEQEYNKYTKELELEKREEDKIEHKIRELRKLKNKARLHPTKEQGPNNKRRKAENNQYISITEIWGEPERTTSTKNY